MWKLLRPSRPRRRRPRLAGPPPCLEYLETRLVPSTVHEVRLLYVVPSNRTPQPQAVPSLRHAIREAQDWYGDQMERHGFGRKTFQFETESDGATPRVHFLYPPQPDDYFREDPWARVTDAVRDAGLGPFTSGVVWVAFYEGHVMNPDGSVLGGVALGAGNGTGSAGGFALLGSNGLALLNPEDLTDDRPYDGLVRPELGPYPMRRDVTFPWFAGPTVSSVSSAARGAMIHEMTHGFGLPHDFRNDENFNGNLMGNGLRGFRGWADPVGYPTDDVHLAYASALALNSSRYFNPGQEFTDDIRPTASILTAGAVSPADGLVALRFTASDAGGLAMAMLRLNGEAVGEAPLSGTAVDVTFRTAHYTPGAANSYSISVYDTQGNRRDVSATLTPAAGLNRAPRPHLRVDNSTIAAGWLVILDAARSSDPDHSAATLLVEWDLDGDGAFDTPPSLDRSLTTSLPAAGTFVFRIRVTDPLGAQTVSAPLAVRAVDLSAVEAVLVNDGSAQRSMIHGLWVGFSDIVGLSPDAFEVRNQSGELLSLSVSSDVYAGRTWAYLAFTGSGLVGGSLADGNYTLTVLGARVHGPGRLDLDGDGDRTAGGDHAFTFHRYYGDADGDRTIGYADWDVFAPTYGLTWADLGFVGFMDYDGDGIVGETDFLQFLARWDTSLGP